VKCGRGSAIHLPTNPRRSPGAHRRLTSTVPAALTLRPPAVTRGGLSASHPDSPSTLPSRGALSHSCWQGGRDRRRVQGVARATVRDRELPLLRPIGGRRPGGGARSSLVVEWTGGKRPCRPRSSARHRGRRAPRGGSQPLGRSSRSCATSTDRRRTEASHQGPQVGPCSSKEDEGFPVRRRPSGGSRPKSANRFRSVL
jgi:hypothetical protein